MNGCLIEAAIALIRSEVGVAALLAGEPDVAEPAPRRLWGQRVAIHAGARPAVKGEIRDLLLRLHSSFWRETGLLRETAIRVLEPTLLAPRRLPLSAIVCLATLGEPLRDADLAVRLGTTLANDSDRNEHTNWGWPLGEIAPLRPPAPARGAQGWWTWRQDA